MTVFSLERNASCFICLKVKECVPVVHCLQTLQSIGCACTDYKYIAHCLLSALRTVDSGQLMILSNIKQEYCNFSYLQGKFYWPEIRFRKRHHGIYRVMRHRTCACVDPS